MTAEKVIGEPSGGDAFQINGKPPMPEINTDTLRCRAQASGTSAYRTCIHATNVVRSEFNNTIFESPGKGVGSPTDGSAIWLDATRGLYSVDDHIRGVQGSGLFSGVLLTNHIEGIQVIQDNTIGTAYCLAAPGHGWADYDNGDTPGYDWVSLMQSHCAFSLRAFYMIGGSSAHVFNNLFYAASKGDATAPASDALLPITHTDVGGNDSTFSSIGVDLVDVSNAIVSGNEMQGFLQPNGVAIRAETKPNLGATVNASSEILVSNNILSAWTPTGVWIGASVNGGHVKDNLTPAASPTQNNSTSVVNSGNESADGTTNVVSTNLITHGLFFQDWGKTTQGVMSWDGTSISSDKPIAAPSANISENINALNAALKGGLFFPKDGVTTPLLTNNGGGLDVSFQGASSSNFVVHGNVISRYPNSFEVEDSDGVGGGQITRDNDGGIGISTGLGGAVAHIRIRATTVSNLNSVIPCNSSRGGQRATVSDAVTHAFGATLNGGGTLFAAAFCDGSHWIEE